MNGATVAQWGGSLAGRWVDQWAVHREETYLLGDNDTSLDLPQFLITNLTLVVVGRSVGLFVGPLV